MCRVVPNLTDVKKTIKISWKEKDRLRIIHLNNVWRRSVKTRDFLQKWSSVYEKTEHFVSFFNHSLLWM